MSETSDVTRRVVDAAAELIAERGYAATTTRAIAERAGVNEVTIFRRFTNKAGILGAIGERFAERAAGVAVGSVSHPESTRETLIQLAGLEVGATLDNGGLALRLAFDARSVPEVAEAVGSGTAGNVDGLVDYLAARQRAGDLRADIPPELLAEAFFALTSFMMMARILMGRAQPSDAAAQQRLVEQMISLYWSGASTNARAE